MCRLPERALVGIFRAMCCRYLLFRNQLKEILRHLGVSARGEIETRYNIAPGSDIQTVLESEAAERELVQLRWGFIAEWKEAPVGPGFVNAQAETIAEKPSFRDAFRKRRCLIPASGFYEWSKVGRRKRPWLFRMEGNTPFFLAGLWEKQKSGTATAGTCAVITTAPNQLMQPIHHRMPAIIEMNAASAWLGAQAAPERLTELLRPFPAERMTAQALDTWVNSVDHDDANCLKPISGDNRTESQGLLGI